MTMIRHVNKRKRDQLRSASLPRKNEDHDHNNNNIVNNSAGTMLRIFNLRQPTNLTGRFPSTVALHAKVEELTAEEGQQPVVQTTTMHPPNLVQPLSLLPDWR